MTELNTRKLTGRLIIILTIATIISLALFERYAELDVGNVKSYVKRLHLGIDSGNGTSNSSKDFIAETDPFDDLFDAVLKVEISSGVQSASSSDKAVSLGELKGIKANGAATNLDLFHMQITQNEMYPEDSEAVEKLLIDMRSQTIDRMEEHNRGYGYYFKLDVHYRNSMPALCKLMSYPREQQAFPNVFHVDDFERHYAEIAAFYIDRLLGFRRALPTTGRVLNMANEIMNICDDDLRKTFFISNQPDQNLCFYGNCRNSHQSRIPFCSKNGTIEGSFMAFLPNITLIEGEQDHPWARSYEREKATKWETDSNYCEKVKMTFPMDTHRDILDFVDTSVLDFLIGNPDRHSFPKFGIFGNNTFHIHFDHAKAFGHPDIDDMLILGPLVQCCVIRSATLRRLLEFNVGKKSLSAALKSALSSDPIAPVLLEKHYAAIDRRVRIILSELRKCIQKNGPGNVVLSK